MHFNSLIKLYKRNYYKFERPLWTGYGKINFASKETRNSKKLKLRIDVYYILFSIERHCMTDLLGTGGVVNLHLGLMKGYLQNQAYLSAAAGK